MKRLVARLTSLANRTWRWFGCLPSLLIHFWYVLLGVIGIILAAVNTYAFYPGFMSNDTIDQLAQALGDKPLEDWHPPVMAMLWRVLIRFIGGDFGVLLVWQVALLWSALVIMAIYIYKRTGRKTLSVLPLALGLAPFVLNFSGVLWKDVQMAVALTMAGALLLVVNVLAGWKQKAVLAMAALFIIYAVNLRYNALFAIVPFVTLILWTPLASRAKYVSIAFIFGGALLLNPVIHAVRPVVAANPASSVMVDDVTHVYDRNQVKELQASPQLKQALTNVIDRCAIKQVPVSVLISCADESDRRVLSLSKYDELKKVWRDAVFKHPLEYAQYRTSQFYIFLRPQTKAQAYVWHDGVVANPYGLEARDNWASTFAKGYTEFIAYDFGFIFRPYFWLIVGMIVVVAGWRARSVWTHARYIIAFAASGVLYVLSYLPAVAAYDFRYTYWSCIAISMAILLAFIDSRGAKRSKAPIRSAKAAHSS